jgi:sec-independent protein translocase protein TatB
MFGVDSIELIIVAIAALLFIGPKELPSTMRAVGRWVGKIRGMARHFTAGIEAVMREAELEEMDRKWRDENARIMREHPLDEDPPVDEPMVEMSPSEQAQAYLGAYSPDEPLLPLEGPAGDDDRTPPPSERELP